MAPAESSSASTAEINAYIINPLQTPNELGKANKKIFDSQRQ